MKEGLAVIAVAVIACGTLAARQRGGGARGGGHAQAPPHATMPRANGGHLPPPPPRRPDGNAKPEVERHPDGHVNDTQHVRNDHWYGRPSPNDPRFHLEHPWEHGHFGHVGPDFRYRIVRYDLNLHRFWFPGGFWFEVAPWDWFECADWCWDCGDDFVIYDDPDHPGWYLLYNIHTGVFVHVMYMGM
jgi:hypothetical protein